jgi:hypothetical protein
VLTLFTIPVTYIYMDRFSDWVSSFSYSRAGRETRRDARRDVAPGQGRPVPARVRPNRSR